MSPADFKPLLSPITIGNVTVRNRAVSTSHGTGLGIKGNISDKMIAYHQARAQGGIGLIIIEATGIDKAQVGASTKGSYLCAADDSIIPGYRRLAEVVHGEGATLFGMLSHSGRNTTMSADGIPAVAPSPLPMDRTRDIPHELEEDEILALIDNFASAARRARDGGLDGIELSYAHGNLVQQFLSPTTNKRKDRWGGSEENRLRFPREVLEATRSAVGPDFNLGIRFSADELVRGGYGIEDGVRYIQLMIEYGKLDFIDVSAGSNADMQSRSIHYPTISMPEKPLVKYARAVKAAVSIPVICVGKISDPAEAENILKAGDADMVGMTRAHIAEPAIIRKILEDRLEDIRYCIHGNEACFGRKQRVGDMACVFNPRTGREHRWQRLTPVENYKTVIIVGGGPAGLEAARVAAKSGHDVTLHERTDTLGGQVRLLCQTPYRQDYLSIVQWLERQARKSGTLVRLNSEMTAEGILAASPDAVIVATGAVDEKPDIPGADLGHVLTAREVLAGAVPGHRVVVGDWDGRHMGMSVAEYLAQRGHAVELVSSTFFIGIDADTLTWRPAYERLLKLGVQLCPLEEMAEIQEGSVTMRRADGSLRQTEADSVVFCTRGRSERTLYRALKGKVKTLLAIGDCWSPRQLEQAIFEGSDAARTLN